MTGAAPRVRSTLTRRCAASLSQGARGRGRAPTRDAPNPGEIPAFAGMTGAAPRVRSTLTRRCAASLSQRARGRGRAPTRDAPNPGEIPAFAGMTGAAPRVRFTPTPVSSAGQALTFPLKEEGTEQGAHEDTPRPACGYGLKATASPKQIAPTAPGWAFHLSRASRAVSNSS